nr:uncharacterized protein LOC127301974 isoform X4 [Lolium perenne]
MSIASVARRKGSPRQQDDNPQGRKTLARRKGSPGLQDDHLRGGKRMRYSLPELPDLPKKLSTPMLAARFLFLRNLLIFLGDGNTRGFSYDYFSLVYFLDACPVLEDFVLCVSQTRVRQDLISAEDSHMRQMLEHCHGSIKNVKILGFCSAKSMVELTCHIIENATSLECLTLDTIYDNSSRGEADRSHEHNKFDECRPVRSRRMIEHAHKGLWAIGRYVVQKVPTRVKLNVKKLCSRCHKI